MKDVNYAIKRHVRTTDPRAVAWTQNAEDLNKKLAANAISPVNLPTPDDVLKEDRMLGRWGIDLESESIQIVPVVSMFE